MRRSRPRPSDPKASNTRSRPAIETFSRRGGLPGWLLFASLWAWQPAFADRPPAAAIASAHPSATSAGLEILAAGGNAFDAAVAVAATLAVVEPHGSGLGGGGFWLLHRSDNGRTLMLDARERAPLAASPDMYLGADGAPIPGASLDGPLAAGIPGTPAALAHLADFYGRLPLARSLAPAVELARDGFEIDRVYRQKASWRIDALRASPAAASQFLDRGELPAIGSRLRQPDLGDTLERLATEGHKGFYQGPTAQALVDGVRAAGGIWTLEDLDAYTVVEREPVAGVYRGWRVVSASPPSSGGVALIQMLNILGEFDLSALSQAERIHLMVEAMRRAYRDRAVYLGDPDQVEVPVVRLTHPFYAAGLARDIDPRRATPSRPARPPRAVGGDTTHLSVLDADGNRVAATLSINLPFGSGFVAPGTGVLLNDEMDDFSVLPGVPNAYGLIGGVANAIAPGKRMLSSMSPTFVESDQGVAILGTPGGSRIITMVLQGVLAVTEGAVRGTGPSDWVATPRLHHQFLPDEILFEPGAVDKPTYDALVAMGHRLKQSPRRFGNMQLIYWDRRHDRVEAASDPRGVGRAEVVASPAFPADASNP
jgi:gamma-glutamyltranspeptidase/glutathione hydrolase